MLLRNEALVAAPLAETWAALLDVPRVARALPGATMSATGVEGAYRGELAVKVGLVRMRYEGVARLVDADEDEHVATFHLQGREARGSGGATATITNRLAAEDGATRVVVETELAVTGRATQVGRGIMEDVAARLIEQFASRLEREVLEGATSAAASPEPLDVGGVAWDTLLRRHRLVLALGAAGLAIILAMRTRRVVIVIERR